MSWAATLGQALLTGLASGAGYGLVALGFTLVWALTRVLALAHGDLVAGGVGLGVLVVAGRVPTVAPPGLAGGVVQVLVTLGGAAALSALVYAAAVRPFLALPSRRRPGRAAATGTATGWVAGGLVAGLLVRQALLLAFPRDATAVADPLRLDRVTASGVLRLPGGIALSARVPVVLGVALGLGLVAQRLLARGRYGRALRAVADDPATAAGCGVPVRRAVLGAFVVAGLLAGAAGLLALPQTALGAGTGVLLGLKAAAAALLGRLGSLRGALVGGLVLGVAEQLVLVVGPRVGLGSTVPAAVGSVLALAALVVLAALRPDGLRAGRPALVE